MASAPLRSTSPTPASTAPSRWSTRSRASWWLPASPASTAPRSRAKSRSCSRSCAASPTPPRSRARTGCRSTPATGGYNATKTIVSSFSRSGGVVTIGTITIDLGNLKLFDADDQSGILDTQSTTTNGGVTYSVAGSTDAVDISALTDSDADLAGPGGDHRRGRRHHLVHDGCGDLARCVQGAHRHPAGFRQEPDECGQPRRRPAGRCRHERGVRPSCRPCRSSSSSACSRSASPIRASQSIMQLFQ